jgi:hypothetical protein
MGLLRRLGISPIVEMTVICHRDILNKQITKMKSAKICFICVIKKEIASFLAMTLLTGFYTILKNKTFKLLNKNNEQNNTNTFSKL